MLEKVSEQLNITHMVLHTKTDWIKELEEIVIRKSGHPKNNAPLKKLLEEKDKWIKYLQVSLKIPDYDPHFLIQAFKRREEVKRHLWEMETAMRLKEEECKKALKQLQAWWTSNLDIT